MSVKGSEDQQPHPVVCECEPCLEVKWCQLSFDWESLFEPETVDSIVERVLDRLGYHRE